MNELYLADPLLERSADDPTRVTIRLMRWGEVAQTPQGPERFAPGAFAGTDITNVHLESQRHGGDVVGIGEELEERADGAYGTFRVADSVGGRELLALITDGILKAASVVFRPLKSRRVGNITERVAVDLRRVAILPRGAYQSATTVEVREDMTEETTTQETPAVAPPVVAYDDAKLMERLDTTDAKLSKLDAAIALSAHGQGKGLDQYRSFGEAWLAATTDADVRGELERVLDDAISSDNPGLTATKNDVGVLIQPPSYAMRCVSAFRRVGLPASGMSVTWPTFDATSDFNVAQQPVGEKNEVVTGVVKYLQGSASLLTFAGASDVSLQLLNRSDPAYRELMLQEYYRQHNIAIEGYFAGILEATTTKDTLALTGADDSADAALLLSKLFEQSLAIETASGVPADVVLCASDVFQRIGENPELKPPAYGTVNLAGVAQASTLQVNVSGLNIVHAPALSDGTMITAESQAAGMMLDGPRIIDALNVAQLGHDYAIWSMGVGALFRISAVIDTTVTLIAARKA